MSEPKQKNKYVCVEGFINNIKETQKIIIAISAHIHAVEEFRVRLKMKEREGYKDLKEFLEIDESQIEKIYDLGFISLFSGFESFMYEILKELYQKNPDGFLAEKNVKYDDIKKMETINEWKDFIIDDLAVEKSADIDKWAEHLQKNFGIKVFVDQDQQDRLNILNLLRNSILHSGSKTNSRFSARMSRYLKVKVPVGDTLPKNRKKDFTRLYSILEDISERMSVL